MAIKKELQDYIEKKIFPSYEKNDEGHQIDHIQYVIERSLKFAKTVEGIDYDMVYTVAAYHDIGHYIDAKTHEKISADMLRQDSGLKQFFKEDQIEEMAQAVEDHRASSKRKPRSIYGKIVSSADRNTSLEGPLKRTYAYRKKHSPNMSLEQMIEESRQHILDKFGKDGYASEKMYFEDKDYETFLQEISLLAKDRDSFRERYCTVNHISLKAKEYTKQK